MKADAWNARQSELERIIRVAVDLAQRPRNLVHELLTPLLLACGRRRALVLDDLLPALLRLLPVRPPVALGLVLLLLLLGGLLFLFAVGTDGGNF